MESPSVIGEGPILIIVADNIQIRSQRIIGALETRNPGPIQKLVERCIGAGANALDINSGPLLRDPEEDMAFLVEAVQEVSDLPLVLDTSNPKALEAGLIACKKKAVINGFSLQPEKLEHIVEASKNIRSAVSSDTQPPWPRVQVEPVNSAAVVGTTDVPV